METTALNDHGLLGVTHLRRFYEQCLAGRRGAEPKKTEIDWLRDNIVMAGLGLPLEATLEYILRSEPAFTEFENWVIAINGGSIDTCRIDRINRALSGETCDEPDTALVLHDTDIDVLSADDLAFWEKNGYVLVREAVSREQVKASEDAVWQFLGMTPDDPDTWYTRAIGKGIMTEFYHHPSLTANRDSLRVHKAFAQLWGTADLWTTTDRTSFNPPERPGYTFQGPGLHWDMSLAPPYYFGTQGLLYLCDTPSDQGAFRCVPGFHRSLEDWLAGLPAGTDPRTVDLDHRAINIGARAGDLVIWHQALPHGSSPNHGHYPRIVQYINMFPTERRENMDWT